MKIIGVFFLLVCTLTSQSQTKKYVIIKHRDKHKEVAVAQGEYVVVITFKGEKIKGHLEVLSETLVRVKLSNSQCNGIYRDEYLTLWTE